MSKHKAKRAKDNTDNQILTKKLFIFIFILFLIVCGFFLIKNHGKIFINNKSSVQLESEHSIIGNENLKISDFNTSFENGISKVNITIFNNSDIIQETNTYNLSLLREDGTTIMILKIKIPNINPHSDTTVHSVVTQPLDNIFNYQMEKNNDI